MKILRGGEVSEKSQEGKVVERHGRRGGGCRGRFEEDPMTGRVICAINPRRELGRGKMSVQMKGLGGKGLTEW